MKVAEVPKSTTAKNTIQTKRQPFFSKEGEGGFFSKSAEKTTPFFNKNKPSVNGRQGGIQPKLTIGKPNDKYEVEADAMADKVVQRLSDPKSNSPLEGGKGDVFNYSGQGAVQTKCATCEQEEKLQKKEEDEVSGNDLEVQRKPIFESNAEQPEANVQAKLLNSPFGDQGAVQTKCATCEQEKKLQKKEENLSESEEEVQTKTMLESNTEEESEVQPRLMLKKTEEQPPEEEEPVQLKTLEEEKVQAKADTDTKTASSDLQSRLNTSKGSGSRLPDDTRTSMESGFGADFSNVKVHTGTEAANMNKDLGARAFTHGSDIYFNKGEYNPGSTSGQHLLAHELTHTLQQGAVVRQKTKQTYHQTPPKIQGVFGRLWSAAKSVGKAAWSGVKKVGSAIVSTVSKGVDWILGKISPILKRIPGYTLLTVILGKDIITGDPVDRNGPNLIKGFIGLIPGGHDLWAKLEESKMITSAFGWLETEISKLGLSWAAIKTAFKTAVSSLSATDVFSPIETFNTKIKPIFAPILANILTLAKKVIKKVAEFVLEGFLRLAGPFGKKVMDILRKAGDTFWTIVGDPIAFLNNLIKAVKGGVNKFKINIKKHLVGGLIGWLTGAMGDLPIQVPQSFDVKGVLHLGLQIMGVTWDNIRQKLVKRVGEPLVKAAETGVSIVKTLITQGPMGLWEMLKEKAAEIKQTIMGGIRNWVITQLVKQGIIKILSFLNPAGALVQAALAIYNGVMFFVENWQRISDFVNSIFTSIGKIASGNIAEAAAFIERAMAQGIPVILSFVARLLNIGAIGKAIKKIIQKIRKPIDKVISKVIDFIAAQVKKLFRAGKKGLSKVKGAVKGVLQWWKKKKKFTAKNGEQHTVFFNKKGKKTKLMVASETPFKLEEHVNRRIAKEKEHPFEAGQKQKLLNAVVKSNKIIEEFEMFSKKQERGEKPKDISAKVDTELQEIANDLREGGLFVGETEVPPSKVTFKMANGKSKNVTASPLTKIPGNTQGDGSSSGLTPKGDELKKAANDTDTGNISETTGKPTKSRNWKHVHLLSHLLHGPYTLWNIVVGNTAVNSALEKFEHGTQRGEGANFKNKSLKDNYIYHYEVNVVYFPSEAIKNDKEEVIGNKSDYPDKILLTIKRKPNIESNWESVAEGTSIDPEMDLDGLEGLDLDNTKEISSHGATPSGDPKAKIESDFQRIRSQIESFIRKRKADGMNYKWHDFRNRRDVKQLRKDSLPHWEKLKTSYSDKKTEIDNE